MELTKVSLVKFADQRANIRRAVEKCDGFKELTPEKKVLLKPNLVMWDEALPYPKFGVITTAVVVEEMVKLLKEHGCSDITIAEATTEDKDINSGTMAAYRGMGYPYLEKKYGVKLCDLNRGPYEKIEFDGFSLSIAAPVLEADFIINLPVLKTHNSTKVTLGFKNLKGCLARRSKVFCHHPEIPLDRFIQRIGEKLAPALTLIDGIYALDRGPAVNGTAHRADLLIASRDMFAADVTGTMLLGMRPDEIGHLAEHARRHDLPLDGSNVEIKGEKLSDHVMPLRWDWGWLEDNSGPTAFGRMGISGIYYPKYDDTICSGCSFLNNMLLILLLGAYTGEPFGNIEFLTGKVARSKGGFAKTFLFGNCIIRANRDNPLINEAVPIKGCPPRTEDIVRILNEHGINADFDDYVQYRASLAARYEGQPQFQEQHFTITA
ncbi:MAG: DUF362 domain-containing protein [Firmicutes bacterium]|nr:DUF362 domain-containing protein [Bacillota bacterium]